MKVWRTGRTILACVLVLVAMPITAIAAPSNRIDPAVVEASPLGTCFDGLTSAPDCSPVTPFAGDSALAAGAQDAQIKAAGGVATNAACGGRYLQKTIVSRHNLTNFNTVFNPPSDGVVLSNSTVAVPTGFFAFNMTSATHDAYSYIAHLYTTNDPQVAGVAAPIYVLTAAPVPRAGPGTMPVPAERGTPKWVAPEVLDGSASIVVFDTSTSAKKMDLAPADGFLDATAGHATFIEGLASAAYEGDIETVDITNTVGLMTEAQMALKMISHPFAAGDVANLSAGTYACTVGDVTIYPLLLAHAVEHLDAAGVHLVGAAGNDATTDPFFPAVWGVEPTPRFAQTCPPGTLYRETGTNLCMVDRADVVTSVGSLVSSSTMVSYDTPNSKTRSAFSNYGDWVEAWAVGENLVSDYPGGAYSYCVPTTSGSCEAPGKSVVSGSEAPSAHLGTLVMWEGTSFAAPQVAAWIAGGMAP